MAESTPPRTAKAKSSEEDLDTLKADLAALKGEIDSVVQSVRELGSKVVATAKRQQGVAADRLAAGAKALAAEIGDEGRTQVAEIEQRIRDHPLTSVGIAFAIGLLFGSLRR
jgi:ElaB/YqjD/DUF883 family membrane-anchored ribosome-binding protein